MRLLDTQTFVVPFARHVAQRHERKALEDLARHEQQGGNVADMPHRCSLEPHTTGIQRTSSGERHTERRSLTDKKQLAPLG